MDSRWQDEKFRELRARTDQELLQLVVHELDQAIAIMNAGPKNGDLFRAEKAYTESVLLLPALGRLRDSSKRLVENRAEELRAKLQRARGAESARAAGH